MSWFNSTKFKALKAKWYKKLLETGFQDIEREASDDYLKFVRVSNAPKFIAIEYAQRPVRDDLSQRSGFKSTLSYESIRDYYYWAEDMANHAKFKCAEDRKIWTLHAQGKSSREIAECVPSSQPTICRKIKKIREYLKLQNRPKGAG